MCGLDYQIVSQLTYINKNPQGGFDQRPSITWAYLQAEVTVALPVVAVPALHVLPWRVVSLELTADGSLSLVTGTRLSPVNLALPLVLLAPLPGHPVPAPLVIVLTGAMRLAVQGVQELARLACMEWTMLQLHVGSTQVLGGRGGGGVSFFSPEFANPTGDRQIFELITV